MLSFEDSATNVTGHLLSVGQVDASEEGIVLRAGFARVVLVQEHWGTTHLQSQLLDALFIVQRQQEGLTALLRLHRGHDGEVLRESITCSNVAIISFQTQTVILHLMHIRIRKKDNDEKKMGYEVAQNWQHKVEHFLFCTGREA